MNFTIGVDYAPGHYDKDDKRNFEAQANVGPELWQIKAAGFDAVRLYGDPAKVWIAAIQAADRIGMGVVYEVSLCKADVVTGKCFDGSGDFAAERDQSLAQLRSVIGAVGTGVFQKTVKLILVGNEVLVDSKIDKTRSSAPLIVDAIEKVREILSQNGLKIPCSCAVEADVWMGINDPGRIELSKHLEPLTINVYPFQWGVDVEKSVSDSATEHSLAWYVEKLTALYPGHPIVIGETGWATQGTNPSYAVHHQGTLEEAEKYCQQLYPWVKEKGIPLLFFMAFDQPTKVVDRPEDAENHYGVFEKGCGAKSAKLLPAGTFDAANVGCSANSAIFTFAGGSNTDQPEFTIEYAPHPSAPTETLIVRKADRTSQVTPWPTITLQPGGTVTLKGSKRTSSNIVASIHGDHSGGSWSRSNDDSGVNWAPGQTVFLPADF